MVGMQSPNQFQSRDESWTVVVRQQQHESSGLYPLHDMTDCLTNGATGLCVCGLECPLSEIIIFSLQVVTEPYLSTVAWFYSIPASNNSEQNIAFLL